MSGHLENAKEYVDMAGERTLGSVSMEKFKLEMLIADFRTDVMQMKLVNLRTSIALKTPGSFVASQLFCNFCNYLHPFLRVSK